MQLTDYLRVQAHANALMNQRLARALANLSPPEWHAPRASFFPSLMATLNHILGVDQYYIACLEGDAQADQLWHHFVPHPTLPDWCQAQQASDQRLLRFVRALDAAACARAVHMPRGGGRVQHDTVAPVLAHVFMHQTHHRGQVHAMLSGTSVAPPQLDEFMLPSEAHLRGPDMAAAGWTEAQVYGVRG